MIDLTKLLDARTSQNASFDDAVSIPFAEADVPALFGQVGLNIVDPVGVIRVQFSATVTIEFPGESSGGSIFILIVRGELPTDPTVYSGLITEGGTGSTIVRTFTVVGADFNVGAPLTGELIYTAFVSANTTEPVRIGPESFIATAYSD